MNSINNRSDHKAWFSLHRATWFSLVAHLVAGVAMVVLLRQGLDTNPDWESQLHYLAHSAMQWTAGWLSWHIAAISILVFYYCVNRAHESTVQTTNGPGRLAILLCVVGIACDLAGQTILIGVVPDLARNCLNHPSDSVATGSLQTMQRSAVVLTGYLGNGLYTLAALLLIISMYQTFSIFVLISGCGVAVGGFALSVATLINSVAGMVWSNVVLVPCILLWQGGILWEARRRVSEVVVSEGAS